MNHKHLTLGFLIVLGFICTAFGQGAHYTYPFELECPVTAVLAGEKVRVGTKFEGGHTGDAYSPTYNWSLSAGTIVSGQGTMEIEIEVGSDLIDIIHVNLDRSFTQAHYPGVQRSANCQIAVLPSPQPRLVDEFRTAGSNCEEGFARLDSFFVELGNDPTATGVIAVHEDAADARAATRRENQLRNHFTFRKFPLDRVTFVRGKARAKGTTQFWLVTAGASMPKIDEAPVEPKPKPTEPYLYAANFLDGVPGCSGYIYDIGEYAKELKSLAAAGE